MTINYALSAQEFTIDQGGTVTTCEGFFFDAGGQAGRHGRNVGDPDVFTICPDGSTGSSIRVFFTAFAINGTFEAFNGPNTSSPVLVSFNEGDEVDAFEVRATASNASGCVTFRFESNSGPSELGWNSSITCVSNCQPIEASIINTIPSTTLVNGAAYIDACPGDLITLTGDAAYPENNAQYAQSNATSTFTWTFQDGTVTTGQTVQHEYREGGGYEIELTVTDRRGCKNSTRIIQRARIAPSPFFQFVTDLPSEICHGDDFTLDIDNGTNGTSTDVTPQVITFTPSQTFSELTLLPDGNGVTYSTPLDFTVFQTGQTLQEGDQILNICATMEHSYLGDLALWLECPDGSRLDLHRRRASDDDISRQVLGEGNRSTTTPDECATYCWTADAPRTMAQTVKEDNIARLQQVPPGDYAPDGSSFDDLIGCPLNGSWTLNILDGEPQDNGTICSWSIGFRADVFLGQPEFIFPVETVEILDNGDFLDYTTTRAELNSADPGPKKIRIGSEDSLMCAFDTTIVIDVLSPLDPSCSNCDFLDPFSMLDTSICPGDMLQFDFSTVISPDTLITYEAILQDEFSNAVNRNRANSYQSVIRVDDHNVEGPRSAATTIEAVCISLENNGDLQDITLEIENPSGSRVTLFTGAGGPGDDLRQTCFSPASSANIVAAGNPFTGTFAARDDWSQFDGEGINGDWTLHAWDADGNDVSQLARWSITLRHDWGLSYEWSPDPSLSCTDCPDPTVNTGTATDYELTIRSESGCEKTIPVSVNFNALDLGATAAIEMVDCNGGSDGSITVTISTPLPGVTYAWEDDMSISDLTRTNLAAGTYTLIATDADGCMEMLEYEVLEPVALSVSVDVDANVSCFAGMDGELTAVPAGGTAPYAAVWDDPAATDELSVDGLALGTYRVVITDANGCTASASGAVTQPDELIATATATPVICRGEANGTATVTTTGGTGDVTFLWSTGGNTATIADLGENTFTVTATDENGCTAMASTTVNEPDDPLTVTATQTASGCSGATSNEAIANVTGGAGSNSFLWSNGETGMTATMLPLGLASVTVTDAGGCARDASVLIGELDPITVAITDVAPSCNDRQDGSLTAMPSGGAGVVPTDFTYVWSNGETTQTISNLMGGRRYGVTVTGPSGCTGEATFDLAIPPPIVITSAGGRTSCFDTPDGSLTLDDITGPNGGPYDVLWSPEAGGSTDLTVTGLAAGDYRVTVTDPNGCLLDTFLTVTQPDSLEAAVVQTNVSCNGDTDGSLVSAPVGGTGPYQFAWSNGSTEAGIADLPIGDYTLSLTDASGCLTITPFTITEPDELLALPTADSVLCIGDPTGAIQVNSTGGTGPFLYSVEGRGINRNSEFFGFAAGEYQVGITDANGCTSEASILVPDGDVFEIDAGPDTSVIFGDSITLTPILNGGKGQIAFTVTPSSPTLQSCFDCPAPTLRPQFPVDVTYRAVDANGCVAEDVVSIEVPRIRNVAVPGGFSPDQNNVNDLLLVHGRPGTRVVLFQVYDRWANLLFEAENFFVNDPNVGWDGTQNDQPVNAGVYLYKLVVEYDDLSQETLSGQTTLIR
ncbi:hypothetical protein A3850_013435 [Lewinella sp. 4G2]|nr:hypothetical protein A3850_013435 [Lewinella sp. 4G2]